MSTPFESYRGVMWARTPEGKVTEVIVTRQSDCRIGRVWLTLYGSWRGTVVLAQCEVDELVAMLVAAKAATRRRE